MTPDTVMGDRVLRLRLAAGLGQQELASEAKVATGLISMVERGLAVFDAQALERLARVLDVGPHYFERARPEPATTSPQLRAYADASQKTVDRMVNDSATAIAAIEDLGLLRVPDSLPVFDGDLNDALEIERIAGDTRSIANIVEDAPVGNAIRAAERLGCVVLPMESELGRHLGLSLRVDAVPVIRVARSAGSADDVPGDRQRFTVAHELGHLVLHSGLGQPVSPADATRREQEAHRFASSFLAPGDAIMSDLDLLGGRVTLNTLSKLKSKWGFSIKAFVVRFRQLGVIDDDQARSLYKQISSRRWNKHEPVDVGGEAAVWLPKALAKAYGSSSMSAERAVREHADLGWTYIDRWTQWATDGPSKVAAVTELQPRKRQEQASSATGDAPVILLANRRRG